MSLSLAIFGSRPDMVQGRERGEQMNVQICSSSLKGNVHVDLSSKRLQGGAIKSLPEAVVHIVECCWGPVVGREWRVPECFGAWTAAVSRPGRPPYRLFLKRFGLGRAFLPYFTEAGLTFAKHGGQTHRLSKTLFPERGNCFAVDAVLSLVAMHVALDADYCSPDMDSNCVMRTACEISKPKPCEPKARLSFPLFLAGIQESVLKVPQ